MLETGFSKLENLPPRGAARVVRNWIARESMSFRELCPACMPKPFDVEAVREMDAAGLALWP